MNGEQKQNEGTLELMREAYALVDAAPSEAQQNQMATMMLGVQAGYRMHELLTEACKGTPAA